ncbi:MAG: hypothetical protein ISS16_02200 [Ignavibacteria bacterium]|nr:hypothetical protein [Ignavibacteria bacterium]
MNSNNFSKAIDLTEDLIDNVIPENSVGIFLLGYSPCNNGKFNPLYLSRCDCDLNNTLKNHIGYFSQFKFCLCDSISYAFFYECKIFHYLSDNTFIINETHPQPPPDLFIKCPVCGK